MHTGVEGFPESANKMTIGDIVDDLRRSPVKSVAMFDLPESPKPAVKKVLTIDVEADMAPEPASSESPEIPADEESVTTVKQVP